MHDRTSPTTFKVSTYEARVDSTADRRLDVLAIGDSYISGEGAFFYREPTDTSRMNKCHNSWLAYSYQKGRKYFPEVASVACSGAKIEDVDQQSIKYTGQDRVSPQVPWDERQNQTKILENYTPGYRGQKLYVTEIKPRVTLVSIGGNDINFSGIVTSCVDNMPNQSCYPTYNERKQLMQQIVSQYTPLKKLYSDIKTSSKGDVYVMGYPEVAKPGGSCGLNVRLDAAEVQFSSDLVIFLNKVIKNAASDAGVFYVDSQKALYGYRLCEAPKGNPGMNGVTKGNDVLHIALGNESFHPTAYGHKLIGNNLVTKTANFTALMPYQTNVGAPAISDNDPLLISRAKYAVNIKKLIWNGAGKAVGTVKSGSSYTLNKAKALANGVISVVIHSDPITIYEGEYDPSGPPVITIPKDIAPGFHTLHIYGKDLTSEEVDIAEVIYVENNNNDYDGDGILNTESSCAYMPDSGIDDDNDGVDDACDTVITEQTISEFPISANTTDYSELALGVDQSEDTRLLRPYIPPVPPPSTPSENPGSYRPSQTQSDTNNSLRTINKIFSANKIPNETQEALIVTGESLGLEVPNIVSSSNVLSVEDRQDGTHAMSKPQSRQNHVFIWISSIVFVLVLVLLLAKLIKTTYIR